MTSSDAFHGANFRRGGFLDHADRYTRAAEFVELARELWDSWEPDAVVGGDAFADRSRIRDVDHHGPQFDVSGTFPVPRSPQRHPVVVQAGDSDEGRDLAARHAEVIFSLHTEFDDARTFYADVTDRLERVGRSKEELLILPGRPSRSATRRPTPRSAPGRSAARRSARPPRSRSSSRCGTATCPRTTSTGRCPTSNRTSTPTRSPAAVSGTCVTPAPRCRAGATVRPPSTCPSATS